MSEIVSLKDKGAGITEVLQKEIISICQAALYKYETNEREVTSYINQILDQKYEKG